MLIDDLREEYSKICNNINKEEENLILSEIRKAMKERKDRVLLSATLFKSVSFIHSWCVSQGLTAKVQYDLRDGDYLIISGWAKRV